MLFHPPSFTDAIDPGMHSLDESVGLALQLMDAGQRVPERIALALRAEPPPDIGRAERMLELLPRIAAPERLLPLLDQIMPTTDTRIRSKAWKLYAAASADLDWAMAQMDDDDPRVAANVVEALWRAAPSDILRNIFLRAVRHSNNRLAGNGLVGLLNLNDPDAPQAAREMARHEKPSFRATAAWAIARIGWRGGLELLKELRNDETEKVRLTAERALHRMARLYPAPS